MLGGGVDQMYTLYMTSQNPSQSPSLRWPVPGISLELAVPDTDQVP